MRMNKNVLNGIIEAGSAVIVLVLCLMFLDLKLTIFLWFFAGLIGCLFGWFQYRNYWRKRDFLSIFFGFLTLIAWTCCIITKREWNLYS